jgi:hypothetical protein
VTREEILEALKPEYYGSGTFFVRSRDFDRLLDALMKAIEQRDEAVSRNLPSLIPHLDHELTAILGAK